MMTQSLMTYDTYKNKGKYDLPYFVTLKKNNISLFYMGIEHTHDQFHSQHKKLEEFWNMFLETTKEERCIALTEGGKRDVFDTKAEAVQKSGESGLLTYLAHKDNIITDSPEPPASYKFQELIKGFSKDEIAYYSFVMVIPQWHRLSPKPDFKEYVSDFLEHDRKESGWGDFDFSLPNMIKIHEQLFRGKFNKNDSSFFFTINNPTITPTIINLVSRADSHLRDEYIVQRIISYLDEGINVFSVFGHTHVVMQEQVLRDFVSKI